MADSGRRATLRGINARPRIWTGRLVTDSPRLGLRVFQCVRPPLRIVEKPVLHAPKPELTRRRANGRLQLFCSSASRGDRHLADVREVVATEARCHTQCHDYFER